MMEGTKADAEKKLIDAITEDMVNSSGIESEYLNNTESGMCRRCPERLERNAHTTLRRDLKEWGRSTGYALVANRLRSPNIRK